MTLRQIQVALGLIGSLIMILFFTVAYIVLTGAA
jgi:hypothetical protein